MKGMTHISSARFVSFAARSSSISEGICTPRSDAGKLFGPSLPARVKATNIDFSGTVRSQCFNGWQANVAAAEAKDQNRRPEKEWRLEKRQQSRSRRFLQLNIGEE